MIRLGQKLLGEGRMDEGIRVLEINAAEDPSSWRARAELADAYERAGNPEKAIAACEEAARLGPENPELQRKLEFLRSLKKEK